MSHPGANQTAEQIEAYYRPLIETGGLVCIREIICGGFSTEVYSFERNEGGQRGRVYTSQGSFYAKSGRNCFHPKGRFSLIVPSIEILDWSLAQVEAGACHHRPLNPRGITIEEIRATLKGG